MRTALMAALGGLAMGVDVNFCRGEGVVAGPRVEDGVLVYPEGAGVSRAMSDAERAYLALHPELLATDPFTDRVGGVRPPGPIACPGEYAPAQAILMSWDGTAAQNNILATMARHITTTGNAEVYMVVDTAGEQTTVTTSLTNAGANMSRVKFFVRTTDGIWIRDYGPRYIYVGSDAPGQGKVRGIVRHTYNRPTRVNDNAFSGWFGPSGMGSRRHPVYDLGMTHGGGNYHLDSTGRSFATQLIEDENPVLSATDIVTTWSDFQNVNTTLMPAFPTAIDSTQHIDMWMQIIGDNRVIISDWPSNVGSTQDVICDNAATQLQGLGYTVYRVPARSLGGVHYTYANMVVCNNLVLLPTYTNATMTSAGHNTQALAAVQQAFDFDNNGTSDKTIVQVPCDSLAISAGVMHCIVMHVPAAPGAAGVNGQKPTAHIASFRTPTNLTPGQSVPIEWLSDDDKNIGTVDFSFSANNGASFPLAVAVNVADSGSRSWTVPNAPTTKGRLRITVRDLDGNSGTDINDAAITIAGTPCPTDLNLDGVTDDTDFVVFAAAYEELISLVGDFNDDGFSDDSDFVIFASGYEALVCP